MPHIMVPAVERCTASFARMEFCEVDAGRLVSDEAAYVTPCRVVPEQFGASRKVAVQVMRYAALVVEATPAAAYACMRGQGRTVNRVMNAIPLWCVRRAASGCCRASLPYALPVSRQV